jgi:hypothetical protein
MKKEGDRFSLFSGDGEAVFLFFGGWKWRRMGGNRRDQEGTGGNRRDQEGTGLIVVLLRNKLRSCRMAR